MSESRLRGLGSLVQSYNMLTKSDLDRSAVGEPPAAELKQPQPLFTLALAAGVPALTLFRALGFGSKLSTSVDFGRLNTFLSTCGLPLLALVELPVSNCVFSSSSNDGMTPTPSPGLYLAVKSCS